MAKDVNANILHIAEYYTKKYNCTEVFKQCFVGQMVHESGNGTSALAVQDLNYGGLGAIGSQAHDPDEPRWAKFSTLEEEADYVYDKFYRHYDGIHQSKSAKEFMDYLWNNHYVVAEGKDDPTTVYNNYLKILTEYTGETFNPTTPPSGSSSGASSFNTGGSFGSSYTRIGDKPTPNPHTVYKAQKLKPKETKCVPIYPDIISIYNQIPDWAMKDVLGEENGKVQPPSGHANKYKKVTKKGDSNTAGTASSSTNSTNTGAKDNNKSSNDNKSSNSNATNSTNNSNSTVENKPSDSKDISSNGTTAPRSAAFFRTTSIDSTINTSDIPKPIQEIHYPNKESKNKESQAKESNATKKEEKTKTQQPNIVAGTVPESAYETIDNNYGCFNVVLPGGAVAKYGGENAKDALKYVQTLAQRQIRFDPKDHSNAIKAPFPGKVQNNNDPFPVDLRIRDLETHVPRIVIDNMSDVSEFEQTTNRALLKLGSDTEKRVVQIENHLATTMRYLFRLASIVPINDIYYGGNSLYEKYHGIRQLDDMLINDGFQTQLDQYLTSTRVEPIIGQVYELLNQVGANLSVILDDNQMAYSNMEHYVKLNDITQYQEPLKMASIHEAASLTKDPNDKVLNEIWGDGFVMDWKLIPVEQQTPLINWRQSIIDDGAALMNTPPLYGTGDAVGAAMTGDFANNIFFKAALEFEGSKNADIIKMVKVAEEKVKQYEDQATNIAKSKEVYMKLKEEVKGSNLPKDFSTAVIAILMCMKDKADFKGLLSSVKENQAKLKDESLITNPLLIALAYLNGVEYVIGDKPTKDPTDKKAEHEELKTRLDFVYKTKKTEPSSENGSGSGVQKIYFNLSIGDEAKWTATQFMEPYSINCHEKREEPISIDEKFQQLVTLSICYKQLSKKFMLTEFDNENWGFFIQSENIPKMYIAGFPGEARDSHIHQGFDIDIEGSENGEFNVQILAPCNAYVERSQEVWGLVVLNAMNGSNWSIAFLHTKQRYVKVGDTVERGQPIAIMGGIGESGSREYAEHIHVELWPDGYYQGSKAENHSIGKCYPGIFEDYCQDAINRRVREYGQGAYSYFRDFGK